jgi:tetratricopeptide (TPR) repeat protein
LRSEFRRAWMVGSYFLVTLAVLTKGSAVVLPFVFLTLDAYPLRRFRLRLWPRRAVWKLLSEKVLILVFCLGFSTLAFLAKWSWVEPEITVQPVPVSRVAQASYAACFYLGKTVWPFGITAFYPRPERGDFWAPEYAASVVAVVFAVALAVWQRAQRPWLSATIFTYLVIASPYLGLARVGIALAADRYSYAPLMVWVVIGCAGLVRLAQRRWSRMLNWAAGAGACIITCGLMALCSNQCRVWGTSELLWAHALAEAEWSSELHRLRGTSLADEGNLEQARAELRESLRLQPGYFEAIYDLGVVLSLSGESDGAVAYLRQAVGMRPGDPRTHMSLGEALARTGQVPEAISSYYRALRFHPSCAEVRFDLGVAFLRQRKVNEAIKQLTEAVTLRPRYTEAHSMLGGAFAIAGRIDDAAAEYDQAVRLDPRNSRLRVELGLTLARQGRSAESIRQLREATIRDRENLEAHHVLGAILASLGRIREAAAEFEEVVRLRPDHKEARAFLERVKGRRM